ncbi:sushi, von Willebrand factor type A, EGF and pentraxin domain-containing protein 1-like [Sycon ciliatum]|uniref:sushi, von Willebrand factor type A, EGF and pentraxin domain-containing protein 1-like n=1 Tax=Sycon ciliatum TaxID=27933 RepID=UPI0031F67E53
MRLSSALFVVLLACCTYPTSASSSSGGCIARYFEAAGFTQHYAKYYEGVFAARAVDADAVSNTHRSLLPLMGIRKTNDIERLTKCFSRSEDTACISYVPCGGHGHCRLVDTSSGKTKAYKCQCNPGYSGLSCTMDACSTPYSNGSMPRCENGGTCHRLLRAPYFACICPERFTGQHCQRAKQYCLPNPCAHSGRCRQLESGYVCDCHRGYGGAQCQNQLLTAGELDTRFNSLQRKLNEVISTITTRFHTLQQNITSAAQSARLPFGFKVIRKLSTWHQAMFECSKLGGHLAVPRNTSEVCLVRALYPSGTLWMGASDSRTEGVWRDVAGAVLSFNHWASSQPDNYSGTEDCLELLPSSRASSTGNWNDDQCWAYKSAFLCRFA